MPYVIPTSTTVNPTPNVTVPGQSVFGQVGCLAGRTIAFNDVNKYGWGGDLALTSAHGDITQNAGSLIDVSATYNQAGSISAIADDTIKFERIIAWCATHPDEVPFALHQLLNRRDRHPSQTSSD